MLLVNKGTNYEKAQETVFQLNNMFEAFEIPVRAETREVLIDETNWFTFEVVIYHGNRFLTRFYYQFVNGALVEIKNGCHHSVAKNTFDVVQIIYAIYHSKRS